MTQRPWPTAVAYNIDLTLRQYWQERLYQHHFDSYKGRGLMKLPEDLRVYQHLIDYVQPEMILEFGTGFGASAVWFADQLDTFCGGGHVVTIGNHPIPPGDHPLHTQFHEDTRITFIEGDLTDPDIVTRAHALCAGKRVLASEDSAHTFDSTLTVLNEYSDLVPKGSWFVVEDGIVDVPDLSIWPGGGVVPAIREFLETQAGGRRFRSENLALYGLTMHFNGWLEAIA